MNNTKIPPKEKHAKDKEKPNLYQQYRKWFISALLILLLFVIFNVIMILLKLQFAIGEELLLKVIPSTNSIFLNYGDTKEVVFDINATNSIFCTATCTYTFEDISLSRQIDKGNFSFYGTAGISKSYNISVSKIGTGQNLYNFKAACKNKKSFFCRTEEQEKSEIAFITLNYDLSAAQKELKYKLKTGLIQFLKEFNITDYKLQELNNKFFTLSSKINVEDLIVIKNSINEIFNKLLIDIESLKVLWYNQSYFELNVRFSNRYTDINNGIIAQIEFLDEALNTRLEEHNQKIDSINYLNRQDFIEPAIINYIAQDNEFFGILSRLRIILSDLENSIKTNSFQNYLQIDESINESKKLVTILKQISLRNFNFIDTEGEYLLNFESDILCSVRGRCTDYYTIDNLKNDRGVNSSEIIKNCADITDLKNIYERENNLSSIFIKSNLSEYDAKELNTTLLSVLNRIKTNLTNSHIDQFNSLLNVSNNSYSILKLTQLIPANKSAEPETDNPRNISYDKLLSALPLGISNQLITYGSNYCNRSLNYMQQNFSLYLPNISDISFVVFQTNFTPLQKINITLQDVPPTCCVFNKCSPCCSDEKCSNDKKLYPIIFLHGHSFNKQNSPEYSLDAFNKIQAKLEKKGYLNAGIVTPLSSYSEFTKGEWGLSGKPVLVKGSYYYTSYFNLGQNVIVAQKSENIETYAIRLKELIDLIRYRTGKDRVIIIAHSMGGLVARSYLDIFGDQSVYKLILIATPNYGIEGSLNDYCPILGERKECSDMSASSVFIKRLNTAQPPKHARLYTISGKGCQTVNEDGDGIIKLDSAQLPYAKNYVIEGKCTSLFGNDLHRDILNIDKYPMTMDYIEVILDEEIR